MGRQSRKRFRPLLWRYWILVQSWKRIIHLYPLSEGFNGFVPEGVLGGAIQATCIDQRDFNAVLAAEMPYPKLTGAFKSHPMLNAVV
ncbi:MAG TPA: hypothetical protein DDZ82_13215 [Rhodobacteraceae bacterium]|nr:hypothetical protein [Paracoccaceae bacterium]